MKLLRVGELGQEKIAALDSKNIIRDLSNRVSDLTSETFNNEYLDKVKNIDLAKQKEINPQTRIGPFVNNPKNTRISTA